MNWQGKIGLGTVQFGIPYGISNINGQTSSDEVSRILRAAAEEGIKILDTASAYGNAEEILGQNDVRGFKVVSKYMPSEQGTSIEHQLNQSLLNLNVQELFGYLAHRPLEILRDSAQWGLLNELKAAGKIEKIGFSLNSPEELISLLDKGFVPDLIQIPYNYFDNRFRKLAVELKKGGCEIHTRSAFLQGLPFRKAETLPAHFDDVKPLLRELQQKENLAGALLKFVLQQPFIDAVIIGVENLKQLNQNLRGVEMAEELSQISMAIRQEILIPSNWPQK